MHEINYKTLQLGMTHDKMYDYFEVNETKYKKVALIHKVVNISERI